MSGDYAPPGRPHIIHWETAHEAIIASADGVPIARLSVLPDDEPDFAVLREPGSAQDRELLFRALVWASEEYALRQGPLGA